MELKLSKYVKICSFCVLLFWIVFIAACFVAPASAFSDQKSSESISILQMVINAVVPILLSAIAAFIAVLVRSLTKKVENAQPDLFKVLDTAARSAVEAAEQIFPHGANDAKFDYAVERVNAWLDKYGLEVSSELVNTTIESVVLEVNKIFDTKENSNGTN